MQSRWCHSLIKFVAGFALCFFYGTPAWANCSDLAGGVWTLVPGDDAGQAFCIMTYEMKNRGGQPISAASGLPWVHIDRHQADLECSSLGAGYGLTTNSQWQRIARNIESLSRNWSEGEVGRGLISRGNSDGIYPQPVAIKSGPDTNADWLHRRSHFLSNGHFIWDLAGNVAEWVLSDDGFDSSLRVLGLREYSDQVFMLKPSKIIRRSLAPLGNYNSTHGMGQNYGGLGQAIIRGGGWNYGANAGIYYSSLNISPDTEAPYLGARCVWVPRRS
jgi:formylglycine-generating enzyme required for sulfatase activity